MNDMYQGGSLALSLVAESRTTDHLIDSTVRTTHSHALLENRAGCSSRLRDGHLASQRPTRACSKVLSSDTIASFAAHTATQRTESALSKVIDQAPGRGASTSQQIELSDSDVESIRVEYKSILEIKNLEPYTVS
jgi:hypothetical protein